jgi:hypothetical protein
MRKFPIIRNKFHGYAYASYVKNREKNFESDGIGFNLLFDPKIKNSNTA